MSNAASDDQVFSNFGLRVGFGSFGFNVAYFEHEDGDGDDTDNGDYHLTSAGMKYSDGPMAVSLTHMMGDADNGEEASATMLSMAYTLAPGVASKTSVIVGEQGTKEGKRHRHRHHRRLLGADVHSTEDHPNDTCPANPAPG